MVVSAENLIFLVTWRPDRHSKLVVTCLLEPIDDVGSNNFWPISAQHSRKSIVRNVQKTRKSHVDFGHPLRKITLTSRPLPRSGSNLQGTLIGTSSTRFLCQLENFSSDPPTLKGPIMEFLDIFESRPLVFTPSIYPCSITGKFFRVGDHLFFFKNTYTGIDSPF